MNKEEIFAFDFGWLAGAMTGAGLCMFLVGLLGPVGGFGSIAAVLYGAICAYRSFKRLGGR